MLAYETKEERRIRMAREYLDQIRQEQIALGHEVSSSDADSDADGASDDGEMVGVRQPTIQTEEDGLMFGEHQLAMRTDPVAQRLEMEILRAKGTLRRALAKPILEAQTKLKSSTRVHFLKGHNATVTCVALSSDDSVAVTGAKDGSIIVWDLTNRKRMRYIPGYRKAKSQWNAVRRAELAAEAGDPTQLSRMRIKSTADMLNKPSMHHKGAIFSIALSSDGQFMASGGRDTKIRLWDMLTFKCIHVFEGHRGPVTSIAFRRKTADLYSASNDRTVKIWNTESRAYSDTLFGHQSEVTGLDCLYDELPVSCSTDRTVRIWKVEQQSQLLYKDGHDLSIDCVCMLNDDRFITGSQDSGVAIWSTKKKKPMHTYRTAHKGWIGSVACTPYADVAASGSDDGFIRIWQCGGAPPDTVKLDAAAHAIGNTFDGTPVQIDSSASGDDDGDDDGKLNGHHNYDSDDDDDDDSVDEIPIDVTGIKNDYNKLRPLFAVPMTGNVNSLRFATSGKFLIAAVGRDHRLGRWSKSSGRNGIAIVSLM
jgi:ribosomal RNA-processing protein 9